MKDKVEMIIGGMVFGLLIGGACQLIFGTGFWTGFLILLVLSVFGAFFAEADESSLDALDKQRGSYEPAGRIEEFKEGFNEGVRDYQEYASPKIPVDKTAPLFEEPSGGLEKDLSARFTMLGREATMIRFECSEFQMHIPEENGKPFWCYAKLQNFQPLQIATRNATEWWWFRGGFYKVEFEKGHPSADLALDSSFYFSFNKVSVSNDVSSNKQGYSADEIAEGVFEMEGKTETDLESAKRLDEQVAILLQKDEILRQEGIVEAQETIADYGLSKDETARVFLRDSSLSTQVCIESSFHQPPEVLVREDTQFEWVAKLQHFHPVLVDKKTGRGKHWKSEIVAEWWWFRDNLYIAKRKKGYQSKLLLELSNSYELASFHSKAEAWIPKYTIGDATEEQYGEGYAPEEVARLVLTLEGQKEDAGATFDRIQAAKDIISRSPKHLELWDKSNDEYNEQRYEEYLEAKRQGYSGGYSQWAREDNERIFSDLLHESAEDTEESKPNREPVSKSVKMYVWQRDSGKCVNCGSNEKLEYDHIIPVSKGGSNTDRNIQLLCERCNRSKGASIT